MIKIKKYRLMILGFSILYALAYMIAVGVISYLPNFASSVTIPIIKFYSIGISIIPFANIFIFIFYSAIIFLSISSFLVGLNITMTIYARKANKNCKIKKVYSKGILGILPAFFTSFSCCSSGLLALAIGQAAFSSLSIYSKYMAPITIVALAAGTFLLSKRINEINSFNINSCCEEDGKSILN